MSIDLPVPCPHTHLDADTGACASCEATNERVRRDIEIDGNVAALFVPDAPEDPWWRGIGT